MALHSLITTKYPRDYFGLVSFGASPARSSPSGCPRCRGTSSGAPTCTTRFCWPAACWRTSPGTKQIIMITDGEPTAHIEGGEAFF